MFLSYAIALSLILAVSLAIFQIAKTSHECSSYWVNKMVQMTKRLNQLPPLVLAVGFVALIFVELGLIILVLRSYAGAIKGLFVFATFNCIFIILTLWLDKVLKVMGKYPWLIVRLLVSAFVSLSWLLFPGEWAIYNLVGIIGGIALLSIFPSLTFKRALALGVGIIVYDIVGVYVTGWIVQLAGGLNFLPPAVIIIPAIITNAATAAPNLMMIGIGDIFFGGILMATARIYGAEKQAFLGYSLAIVGAYAMAKITSHGVPATMFIVPLMLLAIWLVAKSRKDEVSMAELMA